MDLPDGNNLPGAERAQLEGHERIHFTGFNLTTGHEWPPKAGMQSPANRHLQPVIGAVAKVSNAVAGAKGDPNLSDAGRAAKTQPEYDAAYAAIEKSTSHFAAEEKRLNTERAKLFAPPALDPGDAVNATMDAEIRSRLGNKVSDIVSHITAAGDGADRLIHAILRDPFANPARDIVMKIWTDRVRAARKAEADALELAEHDIRWAANAVGGLRSVLDRSKSGGAAFGSGRPKIAA